MNSFKFYETIKNKEINNRFLTLSDFREKLIEEVAEVIEEIHMYNNEPSRDNNIKLHKEIFDVFQVMILILEKQKRERSDNTYEATRAYIEHIDKLSDRGWEVGRQYEIKVD